MNLFVHFAYSNEMLCVVYYNIVYYSNFEGGVSSMALVEYELANKVIFS